MQRFILGAVVLFGLPLVANANLCFFGTLTEADTDRPQFEISYTVTGSFTGLEIVGLDLTIGDPAYGWDFTIEPPGGTSWTTTGATDSSDGVDGGAESDLTAFTFTDFQPGEVFEWLGDIDLDGTTEDTDPANTVLFNNGAAPNAVATIELSDGRFFSFEFLDGPPAATYEAKVTFTPEPASFGMLLIAGVGVISRRRRRRRER